MMTKATLALAALALAFVPATSQADDVKDFVKRLKGSVKSETKSRFSSSSSSNRGGSSSTSASTKTRNLNYSSGSVPTSVRRAASQNKVGLNSSQSGGTQLSYAVDSQSKISRDDILFRKGSTEFADRYSREIVRDLAYAMQDPALRGMQFVIEGHASADGSYGKNLDLSQRRAERIVSEMIRLGVDPYSLIAVGYGESEAIYDSYSSETLLATDRKVVVYRMD